MIPDFSLNYTTFSFTRGGRGGEKRIRIFQLEILPNLKAKSHARGPGEREKPRERNITAPEEEPFHSHKIVVTSAVPKGRLRKWPVLRQSSRLHAASYIRRVKSVRQATLATIPCSRNKSIHPGPANIYFLNSITRYLSDTFIRVIRWFITLSTDALPYRYIVISVSGKRVGDTPADIRPFSPLLPEHRFEDRV